jgi:hypothetical protein
LALSENGSWIERRIDVDFRKASRDERAFYLERQVHAIATLHFWESDFDNEKI